MPTAIRQTRTGAPPSSNGSVLQRIAPVKPTALGHMKVAVYGGPGTGKTRLACSFPKPMLLIGTEDGTASVAGVKGLEFVMLQSTDELTELVEGPIRAGKYASVGLDNGTKFREMRITELFATMGVKEIPERKPFLYADPVWKSVWTNTGQDLRNLWRPLLDLPRVMPLNVIFIAQEQNLYEESGSSELIKPKVGSALGKSLCDWLHAECDYVAQTMIRAQVRERPVMVNGRQTGTKQEQTGKKEYCLRVGPHEVYQAKFRLPEGRTVEQEVIVNPSYEKIAALIRGDRPAAQAQKQG